MSHPQTHVRSFIAECIDTHAYSIGEILSSEVAPLLPNEAKKTYLAVLVYLLSDEETEVALKLLRALKKMLRQERTARSVFVEDAWLESLAAGITNPNEVVGLRFMELVVAMSNADEAIHKKLVEKGKRRGGEK